jgi:hypothetical protein
MKFNDFIRYGEDMKLAGDQRPWREKWSDEMRDMERRFLFGKWDPATFDGNRSASVISTIDI